MKLFIVKRYLVETFEVEADSRKEAVKAMENDEHGGPYDVKVIKQTYQRFEP